MVNGNSRGYTNYRKSVLIWDGQLCNFVKNYDRIVCKRGDWKTWKTSVFFWQNRPSLVPDRVPSDWVKASLVLGLL